MAPLAIANDAVSRAEDTNTTLLTVIPAPALTIAPLTKPPPSLGTANDVPNVPWLGITALTVTAVLGTVVTAWADDPSENIPGHRTPPAAEEGVTPADLVAQLAVVGQRHRGRHRHVHREPVGQRSAAAVRVGHRDLPRPPGRSAADRECGGHSRRGHERDIAHGDPGARAHGCPTHEPATVDRHPHRPAPRPPGGAHPAHPDARAPRPSRPRPRPARKRP